MSSQSQRSIQLDSPVIMGYMSIDGKRRYHKDLSQLKYLNSIPKRKLELDLNHDFENAVKRNPEEDEEEKISLLLKSLLDLKPFLKFLTHKEDHPTFVAYRTTLISIMICTHNQDPISVVASKFKNCIYLCSVPTPKVAHESSPLSDQHLKILSWGYKFEQYMLSDSPRHKPNAKKPVLENEEFCICYTTQIGRHKLYYAAQIAGMLATHPSENLEPPDTSDFKENLNYLRKNNFVELKTNKEIHSHRQEQNFKKYKMFRCWCLCYLAGLKGLLVGYRDEDGIIQRVQWFETDDIARYCEGSVPQYLRMEPLDQRFPDFFFLIEYFHNFADGPSAATFLAYFIKNAAWDSQTAIDYLEYFLSYIEKCFRALLSGANQLLSEDPQTLRFDIDNFQKITVTKDIYNECEIVPEWFTKHIHN